MNLDTIYCEDCLATMARMPDGFVDLTVTSPPYDNLRDYKGYSFDFESTAKELFRVTKTGGVVVWVVGDATIKGSETGTSFRQALYFKEVGFRLHDTMIWIKDGGGAIGSNKCYTQNFDFMFVLTKDAPRTINILHDKQNLSCGKNKGGAGRRKKDGTIKREKRLVCAAYSRRNNWWYVSTQRGGQHPAVFPEALARDHILSWSSKGDLVYDPFMGSGTTAKMALLTDRHFIGSEISAEYCQLAETRIARTRLQIKVARTIRRLNSSAS